MAENFDKFNPIYMMAFSGARGNIKQIRQLAGMRGLMSDPKGEIIDRPIKANFREGLSVLEYFISTHGARKGLADTALRTADSGYLTRRLVDVAQDVIIREIDCGTTEGVPYRVRNEKNERGREPHRPLPVWKMRWRPRPARSSPRPVPTCDSMAQLRELDAAGIEEVTIRTIMTCHAEHGVCQKCYGWDLATGPSGEHRHGGGHHRRPVHRRARHPADDAYVPHRRRCRRGHHPRSASCSGAVRGPQAQGPGSARGNLRHHAGHRRQACRRPSPSTTRRATTASTW